MESNIAVLSHSTTEKNNFGNLELKRQLRVRPHQLTLLKSLFHGLCLPVQIPEMGLIPQTIARDPAASAKRRKRRSMHRNRSAPLKKEEGWRPEDFPHLESLPAELPNLSQPSCWEVPGGIFQCLS